MTYADLVERTAARVLQQKKTTRATLEAFFAELAAAVWRDGRVIVPGLASFQVRARRRRNLLAPPGAPRGIVTLPEHRAVVARVSKEWRRR